MSGVKISRTRMIVGAVCVVIGLVLMSGVLTRGDKASESNPGESNLYESDLGGAPLLNETSE